MTDEDREKWLNEPASRADVAELIVQMGVLTTGLANTCTDLLRGDKSGALEAMREVVADHHEYARLMRKFMKGPEDE